MSIQTEVPFALLLLVYTHTQKNNCSDSGIFCYFFCWWLSLMMKWISSCTMYNVFYLADLLSWEQLLLKQEHLWMYVESMLPLVTTTWRSISLVDVWW